MRVLLLLLVGCATAPRGPVKSDCTRTVAPGEDLRAIVASLPANAVVCLQPGSYPVHLRVERSLTLRGLGAGVILDGGHHLPTVEVVGGDAEVLLERLTLTGGSGGALGRGGNLHVHDARTVTLREVIFEDGASENNGGGAILARSGTVVVEGCQMRRNRGKRAQAVLVDGPAVVTLRRCTIEGEGLLIRVVGVGELHLDHSTVSGELRATGDTIDAPTVTVTKSVVGKIEIEAPGPQPSVKVD